MPEGTSTAPPTIGSLQTEGEEESAVGSGRSEDDRDLPAGWGAGVEDS